MMTNIYIKAELHNIGRNVRSVTCVETVKHSINKLATDKHLLTNDLHLLKFRSAIDDSPGTWTHCFQVDISAIPVVVGENSLPTITLKSFNRPPVYQIEILS